MTKVKRPLSLQLGGLQQRHEDQSHQHHLDDFSTSNNRHQQLKDARENLNLATPNKTRPFGDIFSEKHRQTTACNRRPLSSDASISCHLQSTDNNYEQSCSMQNSNNNGSNCQQQQHQQQQKTLEHKSTNTTDFHASNNNSSDSAATASLTSQRYSTFSTSSTDSSSASSTVSSAESSCSSSSSSVADLPSLILPYLYVGDQAQTQIDTISSLNISYILSLQSLPKFLSEEPELEQTDSSEVSKIGGLSVAAKSEVEVEARDEDGDKKIEGLLPSMNSSKDYLVKIKASDRMPDNNNINHLPLQKQQHKKLLKKQDNIDEIEIDNQAANNQSKHSNRLLCDSNDTSDKRYHDNNEVFNEQPSSSSRQQHRNQLPLAKFSAKAASCPSSTAILGRCNRISSSVQRLIRGKCINISDTFEQLLDKFFEETHNFIEEARRNKCNILVHCKAGISRSPTVAIAYLMKWKRLHLQDAYNFVKRCRPQISPNLNFMGQLVSYERHLHRDLSKLPSPTSCCLPGPRQSDNMATDEESRSHRLETIHIAA